MNIFDGIDGLNPIDVVALDEFNEQCRKDLDDYEQDRKRRAWQQSAPVGWYCPNCKNYHSPDTHTCPEPSRSGSLRGRIGQVHNG